MVKIFNDIKSVNLPVLDGGQLYIYVLENSPQGNIKVGRTTNIQQRLRALSGSNGGGNHIVKIAVSEPTYLYTLERIIHSKFDKYRIDGTEWFDGNYVAFEDACGYVDELFSRDDYKICNEIRKNHNIRFGITKVEED